MKGARRVAAEKGRFGGGPIPFGYRRSTTPGLLEEDPAEAVTVRRIFGEYVAGRSQRQIARDLDAEGERTKLGGRWAQAIIRRILANPIYRGSAHVHGEEHEGDGHPALVSPELWEDARRLRESLARTKGGGRGPMPKGNHLFRHGHLRCGCCGDSMIPRTIRPRSKSGNPYEAYLCYSRVRNGPEACSQTPVPRAHVDEAVYDYFTAVALDVAATREQFAKAHDHRLAEAHALREGAERDGLRAAESVERIRQYVREGRIEPEELASAKGEAEAAQAKALLLAQREAEIDVEGSLADVEEAVLGHLARLRSAIIGRVADAEGIEAVRAALLSTFESFTLHHAESQAANTKLLDPDLHLIYSPYYLEPRIRDEAIEGHYTADYEEEGMISFPRARRMPLPMRGNGDTEAFTT
jgi:site-specific DNA recombinase